MLDESDGDLFRQYGHSLSFKGPEAYFLTFTVSADVCIVSQLQNIYKLSSAYLSRPTAAHLDVERIVSASRIDAQGFKVPAI